MKAVILAAGRGSRLGKYTKELPKGMLKISDKTLIELQIEAFKRNGIKDIIIVRGYAAEKIRFDGIKYYDNKDYNTTNMVVSFFKAKLEFDDDIIVSYSDIFFEDTLLKRLLECKNEATILVDSNWEYYWLMRYGCLNKDIESLIIDHTNHIIEIGKENVSAIHMDARYIGLMRFSKYCLRELCQIADIAEEQFHNKPWKLSGRTFNKAYMTDLIQAAIDKGVKMYVADVKNGWLEIDTEEDYMKIKEWIITGEIKSLISNINDLIY